MKTMLQTQSVFLKWSAIFVLLGAVMYPIAIGPMINPKYYQDIQSIGRKGINQEEIQPNGMKVWSDPFNRK